MYIDASIFTYHVHVCVYETDYTHMYVCMYASVYVCMHAYMYVCVFVCMHTHVSCSYIYLPIMHVMSMCTYTCVNVSIHMPKHLFCPEMCIGTHMHYTSKPHLERSYQVGLYYHYW